MKNKVKLILASAVFVAALMLLVPLSQTDMSGGGGESENNVSDSVVLSDDDSKIIYVNGSYQDSDSNDTNEKSYKTIQEAIDAASSGDMISIAAGTYTENLTINKKIILRSC